MATFQIQLSETLTGVLAVDAAVRLIANESQNDDASLRETDAVASLQAAAQSLKNLDQAFNTQLDELRDRIHNIAVSVANIVMNDEDLIAKRTEQFVNTAIDQFRPSVPDAIFVHPSCVAPIQRWMETSNHNAVIVEADASVKPGDCRIESGGIGVAAALDAFLSAALSQLAEASNQSAAA